MNTPPLPRGKARAGLVLPLLLALAGCQAEASEHRTSVILVVDSAPWLEPVVGQLRDAGYSTALVGQLARESGAAAFDAHCTWQPDRPQRRFGPTVLQDGQLVTFPDDVFAPELFAGYLASFADITRKRPFFACYALDPEAAPAAPDSTPEDLRRETIERLHRAFADSAAVRRPTVVIAAEHGSSEPTDSTISVLISWLEEGSSGAIVERKVHAHDLRPTLLELANRSCAGIEGSSFAADLLPREIRQAAPR